jgi:hypothetical protein
MYLSRGDVGEFLDANDMVYIPADVMDGGEGQQRHIAAGRPMVPSLYFEGEATPLHHPSQVASVLGSPPLDTTSDIRRVAWDSVTVLEDFIEMLHSSTWEQLLVETPYRNRTTRNLTVNVFRPIAMLPDAWKVHHFDWYTGEADTQQEMLLRDKGALVGWAASILVDWQSFLLDHEDEIAASDPLILSNRGDVPYSTLLVTHRYHASNHHRQIRWVLEQAGVDVSKRLRTEAFSDVNLAPDLWS